ncbi:baseplate assembly protein [Niallia sp. 01092]|uniref:baseplate assembly protein n=1 Tax=unclassified Niallia TaxID=2837522 RepID=UPI003FD2405F
MVRFNLPDIDFVDVDAEELEIIGLSKYEELMNTSLSDADPRRKFLQAVVYMATLIVNNIDYTGKQTSLAYAVDDFLEHIGVEKKVSRLEPQAAITTIRFEVSNPEMFIIPKGSRVSVNELNFAMDADTTIQLGATYVDVAATCEDAGTIGNGYLPGQITNIVDPLPWVSKAYNIVKSDGGVDWEDDDRYAERIQQSNERYSTAGPEEGYKYHVRSTHQAISDVQVLSPSDGVVEIVPLLKNGELPSVEILNLVFNKCNDKYIRPLTDKLLVSKPGIVNYDIDITYYLTSDKDGFQVQMQEIVQEVCDEYILWQKSKLGRSIDASELIARLKNAGISRIIINSEQFKKIEKNQVAWPGNVLLNYGGLIDE